MTCASHIYRCTDLVPFLCFRKKSQRPKISQKIIESYEEFRPGKNRAMQFPLSKRPFRNGACLISAGYDLICPLTLAAKVDPLKIGSQEKASFLF